MVPVGWLHDVASVVFIFGSFGADGGASTFTVSSSEIHPAAFFTVTSYVPGATELKTPVVFE
jgi:hypothetical protein